MLDPAVYDFLTDRCHFIFLCSAQCDRRLIAIDHIDSLPTGQIEEIYGGDEWLTLAPPIDSLRSRSETA
jgi:hypothetical protein